MYNYILNVKALLAAFNQEKALVGTFSVIVQLHRLIVYSTSLDRAEQGGTNARPVSGNLRWPPTLIDIDRRRSAARYVLTGNEVIL